MQSTETWRPIVGYQGRYEVSDCGSVASLSFGMSGTRKVLKPTPVPSGYLTVVLYRDGARTTKMVHRLVAEAFCHRPDGMTVVRHLDGSRVNNLATNLRWGTPSENSLDCVTHGTHRNTRKTHCAKGHEFTPENTAYYEAGKRCCKQCNRDRYHANKHKTKES